MALRAADDDQSNAPVPGLSYFWQDAEKSPSYDWDQWLQLFEVAVLARHSISVSELTRNAEQQPRAQALMGNMEEAPAARKVISLLYISLGKTGRKMLMDKFPQINILLIQLQQFLQFCNECFQIRRNRTMDRHTFLSRKQKPSESLHQYWNVLNGLAAKCDFGNQTEGLVYDVFVLNMANKQVHEKLCTEPKETPAEALQFAIAFEDGLKRQRTYGYIGNETKIKEEPVCTISGNRQNTKECWRCGAGNFTMDHLKFCKGPNATCNYCGRKGHLEKVCNQKKKDNLQQSGRFRASGSSEQINRRVRLVDQEEEDDDNFLVLNIDGQSENIKPYYMEGFINGNRFKTMIDSGSPVTIFALDEIKQIMQREKLQVRQMIKGERYVDFNGKPLNLLGYVFCELQVGDQYIKKARILVTKSGTKSIIGREWLSTLKYTIAPANKGECEVNSIEKEEELSTETKQFCNDFPQLFKRNGKIKDHEIKIKLKPDAKITQQKGRRIPIQLQNAVDAEIKRLLKEGHIEKINEIKDDVFIQPTVITVKKDRSVKIALDARALNQAIDKDKYQMPNLDNLLDMVAEKLDNEEGEAWYSSVDMTYAYGQIPLHLLSAKHCNFQIIGGESTGTYRFVTGFYGLTVMPTEFQKVMDLLLAKFREVFVFIDDILIVTKGNKAEHLNKVREILKVLDKAELQLKAGKCKFAKQEIEWLGFNLTNSGISPINSKVQGITEKLRPTNLKELRSFLGAVNQFNRFVPDLATICFPFRSILKKEANWEWNEEHEKAFKRVNKEVRKVAELTHFKRNKELRIICDASKQGLGAVLQQKEKEGWKPISYASRFLTELEAKYSINELELLAVVWSVEHFKNYVYGINFGVVLDHKALQSVLKSNKGNKTYSSRLTRWVNRLLPFDFNVVHEPGRTLGLADYLSRHPSEYNGSILKAEELFNNWFTINVVKEIVPTLNRKSAKENEPIRSEESFGRTKLANKSVLTIHQPTQSSVNCEQINEKPINAEMANDLVNSKISQVYVKANYENDKNIQKIIRLLKKKNSSVIARLPPPWREKFSSFSLDSQDLLYMDQRLVIPKDMRGNVLRAIHFGHTGRDAMLREASDVWWPRIHREIIEKAKSCVECQNAGKNLKCLKSQKDFGKLPEVNQPNDEISLDFAGPFQNARKQKKYLLVSVDNNSGWPDAMFLPNPTAEKVIEFLLEYLAKNGIPKRIRTDPGTVFTGDKFKAFCREKFIQHIVCPRRDHRGNGKVERMIRTVNERLRTNRNIIVQKDTTGISNILFALRSEKGADNKSAFEKQMGRTPNTLKSAMIRKCILEEDPKLQIEPEDFSEEADSTILVRERVRGTKLEGNFKKMKGKVTAESEHTITIQPKAGKTRCG